MKKSFAFEHSKNKNAVVLLFLFCSLFLLLDFYSFSKKCLASEKILINELQIAGEKSNNDFIEFYNPGSEPFNLKDYVLVKRTAAKDSADKKIKVWEEDYFIDPFSFYVWANDSIANSISADISSPEIISSDNGIAIKDASGKIIDSVGWGSCENAFVEKNPSKEPGENKSIGRVNFKDTDDNSIDFIVFDAPSPGEINFKEDEEEAEEEENESPSDEDSTNTGQEYSSGVRLNEILPNPKGDEKEGEFIELYNEENFSINLKGWILKDASKTKFVFPSDKAIGAGGYLTVYRPEFKFALNNTGSEDVFLLDPNGDIVSKTTYDGAKEDVSFSFDGSNWKWSKYLTPGKANKFGTSSKLKATEIKEGYVGVPVEFSLEAENDNFSKVTWDFGDKKKSYLKNPTHTYFKKGKYKIKVSASGETENISDSFTLKIEDYPRKKVEILAIMPNPFGKDLGQEWIELKNNEKEAVNLKDWKIATGQTTLINHLIKTEFEIGPGESRQITREDTFFTLNNSGMTLELRYPDGKTADKLTYAKDKIADDEIYVKEGGHWVWFSSEEDATVLAAMTESEEIFSPLEDPAIPEDPIVIDSNVSPDIGKFSLSTEWQNKKKNRFLYLAYGLKIKTALASAEKIPLNLESQVRSSAHQNLPFQDGFFIKINSFFNKLFSDFSNT